HRRGGRTGPAEHELARRILEDREREHEPRRELDGALELVERNLEPYEGEQPLADPDAVLARDVDRRRVIVAGQLDAQLAFDPRLTDELRERTEDLRTALSRSGDLGDAPQQRTDLERGAR